MIKKSVMIRIKPVACLIFSLFTFAAHGMSIHYSDTTSKHAPLGVAHADLATEQAYLWPLVTFAPFRAHSGHVVPGFTDPLGTGVDPEMRVLRSEVHHMDVLGDFEGLQIEDNADVELPDGVVRGSELLVNFVDRDMGKEVESYSGQVLDLDETGKALDFLGNPVTSESAPLSLAGFGNVSEYMRPLRLHWSECPAQNKRMRVMIQIPNKLRRKYKPNPRVCTSI